MHAPFLPVKNGLSEKPGESLDFGSREKSGLNTETID